MTEAQTISLHYTPLTSSYVFVLCSPQIPPCKTEAVRDLPEAFCDNLLVCENLLQHTPKVIYFQILAERSINT